MAQWLWGSMALINRPGLVDGTILACACGPGAERRRGRADFFLCRACHANRILMCSPAPVKTPAGTPAAGRKPQPASPLVTRFEQLRKMLRPTPHVPLAMEGMNLFAKLEYVNPVGSIKDRPAFWILRRAA